MFEISPRWLLYATLIALPFGTHKLLFQFTPGFHEYETAAIYAADLFLAAFVTAVLIHAFKNRSGGNFKFQTSNFQANSKVKTINSQTILLMSFLSLAGISVFFAPSHGLALYSFARLLFAAAFAVAVAYVLRRGIVQLRHMFGILAASAIFQSLIVLAQFARQRDLGLWFLGEPALSAHAPGIAKFTAEGGKILRAYGTFPHPNVLGAFLVLGLLSCVYLWFVSPRHSEAPAEESPEILQPTSVGFRMTMRVPALTTSVFFVLLGLVLTFSRSAWLIGTIAIAVAVFFFAVQMQKSNIKNQNDNAKIKVFSLLFMLFISPVALFFIFKPFILSRAPISAIEPSVVQRLEYNRLSVALIAQHPFGVGIGNQVLYSVRNGLYEKFDMTEVWQWEPIHNIYLLMASEIGIAGLAIFLLLMALTISNIKFPMSNFRSGHFIRNLSPCGRCPEGTEIRNFQNAAFSFDVVVARFMLLSLAAFGIVDHFLWTLRPGQLLLWFAIGMLWGVSPDGEV